MRFLMLRYLIGPLLTSGVTSLVICAAAQGQIQTAGTLYVNVDATAAPVGTINVITNRGSLGGVFEARGAATTAPRVAIAGGSGTRGIQFDGGDYMQHATAPGGALVPAPAGVVGLDPTRSIEAWVLNPAIADEETIVSWGHRGGPEGSNISFNYGANAAFGAVGHWGAGPDMGWNSGGGAPAAGQWHYLVYTYDGTTTRVYSDGVLQNSEVLGQFVINTHTNTPICLGTQLEPDGVTPTATLRGSLTIARVRVHDGVLGDAQIANNYQVERAAFAEPQPVPLATAPAHRYSFNEPATNDAAGLTFTDSIGSAHGVVRGSGARFTGARLTLPGGASGTAGYGDLPNGIVSSRAASGQLTVEGWARVNGVRSAQRIFDFGSTAGGEIGGPGGGGAVVDSFALYGQAGASIATRRVEVRNSDTPPAGTNFLDFPTATFNTDAHFAVSWNESASEVVVYENGLPVAAMRTPERFSAINDVNCWLGRANQATDQNAQIEYLELRIHNRALSPGEVRGSFQEGPDVLNIAGPVTINAQPQNQTVVEGTAASFSVGVLGTPPFFYQWQRANAAIGGATTETYSFVTSPADQGATFRCVVSNFVSGSWHAATSAVAVLTIVADTNGPVLLRAGTLRSNVVRATFSERLRADSVGNLSNYSLTGPGGAVSIFSASLEDGTNIVFNTGTLLAGTNYTLTVSGVRDASSNANLIAPGSSVSFRADLRPRVENVIVSHRYSFREAATGNATGRQLLDSIGTAHGVVRGAGASLTGERLVLNGGASATAAYADFPNRLLSTNSVDRGGPGGVTFEAWVKVTGNRNWSRVWDFGSTTGGELQGPGGGGNGLDYFLLSAQAGADNSMRRLAVANNDGASGGVNTLDYGTATFNTDVHLVVTWDEASGEILIYENGQRVGRLVTEERISAINDINNWLGRSNFAADQNAEAEYDEFRIYEGVISSNAVAASFFYGPARLPVGGPAMVLAQPASQTVTELRPVTFEVEFGGFPAPRFQWLRNGVAIPGATNATYTIEYASLGDNGAQFRVAVSNVIDGTLYSVLSSNAVLTVMADTNAPVILRASGLSRQSLTVIDGVLVEFDEALLPATATNLANYSLRGPGGTVVPITQIVPADGGGAASLPRSVSLFVAAPLTDGATYTVRVNNVRDASSAGNVIAPNSEVSFVAAAFLPRTVGTSTISAVRVGGGYDVTASGGGTRGAADDFGFQSQLRSGDFDVQVRVEGIGLAGGYSEAGLMARDGLSTNGAFAAVLASSGLGGVKFQSRTRPNVAAASVGSMPVNYPYTWLRLQRAGDVFSGFGSFDGQNWQRLGSATIGMGPQVYLGFVASSHATNQSVTARFRDADYAGGGSFADSIALPFEPLGPSSRRTGLMISEIMYHPPDVTGVTNSLEYIEIFNGQEYFEDLSGFQLRGDADYDFPSGTILQSGGFLVIARDPAALQGVYGISGVLGPFTNNLPNTRGVVRLESELGAHLLEVEYDTEGEWPAAADGAGHSLVLARPSYGERSAKAWAASEFIGGSPGRGEAYVPDPQRAIVIGEFLAHTDEPQFDFVELFNTSTQSVDISGCWLSDDFGTNKFRIPDPTVLGPRGQIAFDQNQLGFNLSADGEEILLVNSNRTRVLDAVRFEGQANGVSRGVAAGARGLGNGREFVELSTPTPGTANSGPLRRDIVINEIMYNPISGNDDDEYIELCNRGTAVVNVGNWRFVDGIDFTIPPGRTIPAGGYLVIAKNRTNLLARYAWPANLVAGDYTGQLANGGERIALAMPDYSFQTNGPTITTNAFYIVVNEVTYHDGGRWGEWSDGGGSSLELIDPRADNRFAANWADSDESAKALWTLVERTGPIDLGMGAGNGTPNRLEFFIEGPGECLVDQVEVLSNGGTNRVMNPGFESGATGWAFQGTHAQTTVQTAGGFGGGRALRLRAVERGDAGPNRVRAAIATMPTGGANQATLRARVRWLRGNPNFLMRIRGQWIECASQMALPTNLGTPGAPNSRATGNAGPAIAEVTHAPPLPSASQPVVVTARLDDPNGMGTVTLRHRLDPNTALLDVPMNDNGTGGDAVANDGLYSGQIPGYPAGTLVAFHISARDASGTISLFPKNGRECLVRFGETNRPGSIATYRLWVTQSNLTYWATRERNSNEGLDATFVYADGRRVIYNAQTLYSGSPWHTLNAPYTGPLGNTCDYEVNFPADDLFLGQQDFVLNGQNPVYSPTFNQDVSAQAETTAYWFGRKLGLGHNHKRHIFVSLNGQPRGMIYFDHQQPNTDTIEEYYPNDANGRLHKIEDWFEFDDAGNGFDIITCTLQNFVVGGQKRTERYRWTWRPRGTTEPNDFADLFALVDAANATGPEYTSATLNLMDMCTSMRVWALQHMIGNWDSYGYERGKNMYAYKPTHGGWRMLLWDLDLVLSKDSRGTSDGLFNTAGSEPVVARMYQHPPFVREFWNAMWELANIYMRPEVYSPLVDARFAAFRENEVPVDTATEMKNWIAARRTYILGQIPSANFNVTATNFQSTSNYVTISGTAPVTASEILVNGGAYPITWTSATGWSLRVPVAPGTNTLVVTPVDKDGVTLGTRTVTVNYTGTAPDPRDLVVMTEIMYDPPVDQTSFLELFNLHSSFAFDLSGWRVNGLSYTFPQGATLPPRAYLVVGKNRGEYAKFYGATKPIYDEFGGALDNDGETLTLLRPGAQAGEEIIVDKVKFEARAPWPAAAASGQSSLQIIDPLQDNARVSNWTDGEGWRLFTYSANSGLGGTRLSLFFDAAGGEIYLDDIWFTEGSVPEAGANILANGDFATALTPPWVVGPLAANSAIATNIARSGTRSLRLSIAPGTLSLTTFYQDFAAVATNTPHVLSFWWRSGSGLNFQTRLNNTFRSALDPSQPVTFTPGAPTAVALSLPPYPLLWLNEVLPVNSNGITDGQNEREPWVELYNSSGSAISLDGMFLSDSYANLAKWPFPSGSVLQAGEFKIVFADGETNESTAAEWHTNFRFNTGTGGVALARLIGGAPQIVDYLNFDNVGANRAYGSCPDGQLFERRELFYPTPRGTNNCASAPLVVYINEWMAGNTGFLRDPADNDADDWFELYNPNSFTVDLGGLYLTDNLLNPGQFEIPANGQYTIPPSGFLLVWADGEPQQNATNRTDLHVNFQLRQAGEAIGLFAADGTQIDAVTFNQQTNNVSEGRFPEGGTSIYFMANPTPRGPNENPGALDSPEITALTFPGSTQVELTIRTEAGQTYRVEYTDSLSAPVWNVLGGNRLAAGAALTVQDTSGIGSQRFYRVLRVQ